MWRNTSCQRSTWVPKSHAKILLRQWISKNPTPTHKSSEFTFDVYCPASQTVCATHFVEKLRCAETEHVFFLYLGIPWPLPTNSLTWLPLYIFYIHLVYLKKCLSKEFGLFFQTEIDVSSCHIRKLSVTVLEMADFQICAWHTIVKL